MITIETISYRDCTIGRLWHGSFHCFTLELPWRENKTNISCIPSGVYEYKKRISPSKQSEVIELASVPKRTYIQVHAGNYTSQVRGCILVGDGIKLLNRDNIPDVTNSTHTLRKLLAHTPDVGKIRVIRQ